MSLARAPTTDRTRELAAATAALLLMQQVGSKTARDALFLSHFPSADLPKVMAVASVLSLLVVLGMSRLLRLLGPARVLPSTLALNAALFMLEAGLLSSYGRLSAILLYMHVASLGAVLVSAFWSLVSERLDPHLARKAIGKIGTGATLGGAVGGLFAGAVAHVSSSRTLLFALALLSGAAALSTLRWARTDADQSRTLARDREATSSIAMLGSTPYLRTLCLLSCLAAVWAALLDYALKAEVAREIPSAEQLTTFFGVFYSAGGVLTFALSATLTGPVLKKHGLAVGIAVLPFLAASGGLLAAVAGQFAALVALRVVEAALSNGLFRSSYELFFTPLPKDTRRATKTIIDVATTRAGDALGGGLVLVGLLLVPTLDSRVPLLVAAAVAFVAILLLPRLTAGYVDALETALRKGTIATGAEAAELDELTKRTLAESTHTVDRLKLLAEIEAYQRDKVAALGGGAPSTAEARADSKARTQAEQILSGDDERVALALSEPLDPRLVGLVMPMLGHDRHAAAVEHAVSALGERATGAVTDTLLDRSLPRAVRARAAALLATLPSPRAREGLWSGLSAQEAQLRVAAARGIARFSALHPSLGARRDACMRAAAAALEWPRDSIEDPALTSSLGEDVFEGRDAALVRLDASLFVALAVLTSVIERERLVLAARALTTQDRALRGTALEYLENVLDEPAKTAMSKRLSALAERRLERRSERELLDELKRSKI